jgi:hypothetical protein
MDEPLEVAASIGATDTDEWIGKVLIADDRSALIEEM